MSATEKTIENAKNADRQAVRRAIIQLRALLCRVSAASKAEQDTLVERAKKRVMDGR
jgi:hypothetical protein